MRKMWKWLSILGILVGLWLPPTVAQAAPPPKDSGFSLSLTAGGRYGFLVNEPAQSRREQPWGMSLELMPTYRIAIVSLDLGLVYDFVQQEMLIRPGIRLHLGWFYFRLAMPVSLLFSALSGEPYDLGVLFGAGIQFRVKKFSFILEANISPFLIEINNRGLELPLEVRLGVAYHF